MDLTPIWTLIPTGASIVLGLVLLALGQRQRWSDPVPTETSPTREAAQSQISGDFKTRVHTFLEAHRRELLLTAVCLGVLTYALLSAPVQINGEIATSPKEPGRPFYFIHWQRNHLFYFYHQTASVSNAVTGLLALTLTMIAGFRKSAQMARTGLLWSFMSLAGSAQWMVSGSVQFPIGVVLYLLAGAGLLFWSLISQTRIESDLEESHPIAFKWEAVFVILIIALASFGRLFALQNIPYGIEGDEAKWTAEVVSLGLRGDPDSNGLYHRDALPVSFYMQTLFQRMMGPSLFAGRFEVAIFSIIATFVFYLLLRQITNQPLALVAAWLLSSCVFDISASRLANVESHVKIWPILTLALLAWALHKKHWTHHAISGIALTLGLLTYDTVWPLGLVALLITVVEARRNKDTLRNAIQNLAAMLTPVLLSMPFIIPYLSSRLSYYEIGSKGWEAGAIVLWKHFLDVVISWYVAVKQDFIYNRTGPILNGFLLPWLTFGLIAAASTLMKRLSFW
ncbi:MAG: glycosyltransferase family 39 protein, partial [Chloroflexi bacterium]|nr:glycosyltransferase family 39 protein [Chloroflexota bacterium]